MEFKASDFMKADEDSDASAHERFLLEEGLELLAALKNIPDRQIRDSLRDLIGRIAASQKDSPPPLPQ